MSSRKCHGELPLHTQSTDLPFLQGGGVGWGAALGTRFFTVYEPYHSRGIVSHLVPGLQEGEASRRRAGCIESYVILDATSTSLC